MAVINTVGYDKFDMALFAQLDQNTRAGTTTTAEEHWKWIAETKQTELVKVEYQYCGLSGSELKDMFVLFCRPRRKPSCLKSQRTKPIWRS